MEHPQPLPAFLSPEPASLLPAWGWDARLSSACRSLQHLGWKQSQPGQEMRDSGFVWEDEGSVVTRVGRQCRSCLPPPPPFPWQLALESKRGLLFVIDLLMLAIVQCVLGLIG